MRYAMIVDLSRCIGCTACTVACKTHNNVPKGMFWSQVLFEEIGTYPRYRIEATPVLCMHCDNPPCVRVCPTGASYKRDNGIVSINAEKCIGCRLCMTACPYGARQFLADRPERYYPDKEESVLEAKQKRDFIPGKVTKCEFCVERLQEGLKPACVATCPTKARHFGDLDNPADPLRRMIDEGKGRGLREELGTKPSVYYLPR